jgi:hypothetical protein
MADRIRIIKHEAVPGAAAMKFASLTAGPANISTGMTIAAAPRSP